MMCFLALLALGASVSPRAISEPITHRFVPVWGVAIEPGQDLWKDTILVNGTIQQVDIYMEAHYGITRASPPNTPTSLRRTLFMPRRPPRAARIDEGEECHV
ncbi:hypothetical protein E4U61_004175 [Claviceps capensis]|nr:hypothetical protein E4U61_004175 [Claviceps capensis]